LPEQGDKTMDIKQKIAQQNRGKHKPRITIQHLCDKVKMRRLSTKHQKKLQFIDKLLTSIKATGSLKHFAFIVQNDIDLQKALMQATNKRTCVDLMVELGKQYGCKFAVEDIKNIPGSWSANSVKQLVSLLLDLANGGLEHFLTAIKNDPALQRQLDRDTDENFTKFLVQLGQENGYTFTARDVEEVIEGIPDKEIDINKPSSSDNTNKSSSITDTSVSDINELSGDTTITQSSALPFKIEEIVKFLKRGSVSFILASIALIPIFSLLSKNLKLQETSLSLSSSPSPNAVTIYVDPINGSDRNDGTQSAPFKTISHALTQAKLGDTVYLAKGRDKAADDETLPLSIPAGITVIVQPDISSSSNLK
jgi:Protein of unknown function (DUF1565)/Nif11 domain